jgi:hypothetical protein
MPLCLFYLSITYFLLFVLLHTLCTFISNAQMKIAFLSTALLMGAVQVNAGAGAAAAQGNNAQ